MWMRPLAPSSLHFIASRPLGCPSQRWGVVSCIGVQTHSKGEGRGFKGEVKSHLQNLDEMRAGPALPSLSAEVRAVIGQLPSGVGVGLPCAPALLGVGGGGQGQVSHEGERNISLSFQFHSYFAKELLYSFYVRSAKERTVSGDPELRQHGE